MKLVYLFALTSTVCLVTASAIAEVISIPAVADSTVNALMPDATGSTGDLIAAKEGAPDTAATQLTFFYTQFDLPGGLTGEDMVTLNSAQLALSRSGPDLSLTYHVYGVFDGLDAASADSYTWNSGIGFDPANNLVRFLSADEISYYSDPSESAFVGTLDTATPGAGPFDFTSIGQSPTAVANLHDLILNDTDGRLTFYVGVRQNFGVTPLNTFASLESTTLPPPMLTLDATFIPEPSAMLIAFTGCVALIIGRRNSRG
jgi:hypothetical protein